MFRNKVIISNVCSGLIMELLFLCYHGNFNKEAKIIMHALVRKEKRLT